jgi:hypothetical protein
MVVQVVRHQLLDPALLMVVEVAVAAETQVRRARLHLLAVVVV